MYACCLFSQPWGKKEWKGDWSCYSKLWTPDQCKQFKVEKNDDGFFWMSCLDFVKEFQLLTVGYIYPDYLYSSYDLGEGPIKELNTVKLAKSRILA